MKIFNTCAILLGATALIAGAYIVKKGDTLWDLSGEYFQDPFTWPDLWEKNRHIQDPHWIYPGDSLYMGEDQPAQEEPVKVVVKKNPCVNNPDSTLPKGVEASGCDNDDRVSNFEDMLGDLRSRAKSEEQMKRKDEEEVVYYYQQRPQPKIFNAYYQIHSPETFALEDLKKDSSWFTIRTGEKNVPIVHIIESEVLVNIGKKTSQKVKRGDIIEIWDAKKISVTDRKSNSLADRALLQLSGYAQVVSVGDTISRAIIVKAFREIYINKSKSRLKRPLNPINVSGYTEQKEASFDDMAVITYAMDPSLVIGAYSYVLIDRGVKQNFNAGDAVAIWEKEKADKTMPPRLLGRGIITNAEQDNATVLVRELYSNSRRVEIGHYVSISHTANIKK